MGKYLNKFRDSHELNSRAAKRHKNQEAERCAQIELKRLEIADKLLDLLARENRYEPEYAPRAY